MRRAATIWLFIVMAWASGHATPLADEVGGGSNVARMVWIADATHRDQAEETVAKRRVSPAVPRPAARQTQIAHRLLSHSLFQRPPPVVPSV